LGVLLEIEVGFAFLKLLFWMELIWGGTDVLGENKINKKKKSGIKILGKKKFIIPSKLPNNF
jgi:hypothetical protein